MPERTLLETAIDQIRHAAEHPGGPHLCLSHSEAVVLSAEIERLRDVGVANAEAMALWEEWFDDNGDCLHPGPGGNTECFFCGENFEYSKERAHHGIIGSGWIGECRADCIYGRARALVARVREAELGGDL